MEDRGRTAIDTRNYGRCSVRCFDDEGKRERSEDMGKELQSQDDGNGALIEMTYKQRKGRSQVRSSS